MHSLYVHYLDSLLQDILYKIVFNSEDSTDKFTEIMDDFLNNNGPIEYGSHIQTAYSIFEDITESLDENMVYKMKTKMGFTSAEKPKFEVLN